MRHTVLPFRCRDGVSSPPALQLWPGPSRAKPSGAGVGEAAVAAARAEVTSVRRRAQEQAHALLRAQEAALADLDGAERAAALAEVPPNTGGPRS